MLRIIEKKSKWSKLKERFKVIEINNLLFLWLYDTPGYSKNQF